VRNDRAGVVVSIPIPVPDSTESQIVRAELKIRTTGFPALLVHSATHDNFLSTIEGKRASSYCNVDFYWNGAGRDGDQVRPGGYRIELLLDYAAKSQNDIEASTVVMLYDGAARSPVGECGTGAELAIVPMLAIGLTSSIRRRRRKKSSVNRPRYCGHTEYQHYLCGRRCDYGAVSRKRYDREFTLEAVRLADKPDAVDRRVEQDLGLYQGAIRHWREELEADPKHAFVGTGLDAVDPVH
jgi:hypothetical protein